jgi:hypothetical protein
METAMTEHEGAIMKATNWGVSLGGLTFPAWWPGSVEEWSVILGLVVQMASLVWISMQIVKTVRLWRKEK